MKKRFFSLALAMVMMLGMIGNIPVYADSGHTYETRMANLMSGDCDFRIDDGGQLTLIDANNEGNGVYIEMTWVLVFDITPQ